MNAHALEVPVLQRVRRAVIAMLLGCTAFAAPVEGSAQGLNPDNFGKVTPGKSASEVRELLGPPANILRSRRIPGEQWKYPFRRDSAWRVFWVEFSADGVVREASEQPDFDRDPRYRGP